MSIFASPTDAAEVREMYRQAIEELLYERPPHGVDELEIAALGVVPPVVHPAVPVQAARMFVSVLEGRADELAAGALAVQAAIASGPLAEAAAGAVARLDLDGISSPWAAEIGALRLLRCRRSELPSGVAAYSLALGRGPEPERVQVALVTVGTEGCGCRTVGNLVIDEAHPGDLARDRVSLFEHHGLPTRSSSAEELTEALAGALGDMVLHEHPIFEEQIGPLAILDRALTGRAGTLPRPLLMHPSHPDFARWEAVGALHEAMVADGVDPLDFDARDAWLAAERSNAFAIERKLRRRERRRLARRRR